MYSLLHNKMNLIIIIIIITIYDLASTHPWQHKIQLQADENISKMYVLNVRQLLKDRGGMLAVAAGDLSEK